MNPQANRTKKYSVLVAVFLVVIIVFFWLWGYLHTGKINITTGSDESVVTLERFGDDPNNVEVVKQSMGELDARVKEGRYRVKVGDKKIYSLAKVVDVKARESSSYHLAPKKVVSPEPVTDIKGEDFSIFNSRILYLENTGDVGIIDKDGFKTIQSPASLGSISWGSNGYGVGQGFDGRLYEIKNGTVKLMPVPEPYRQDVSVHYAVSTNNRVYVSFGKSVYSRQPDNSYEKIYTSSVISAWLWASNNKLAITSPPGAEAEGEKADIPPVIEIIDSSGSLITKKELSLTGVAWSPNGEKLILTNNSSRAEIYDASLNLISHLPSEGISSVAWQDNETIYYASRSLLLAYSIGDLSYTVGFMPNGITISEAAIDNNNKYLYFKASGPSGSFTLQRLKLEEPEEPSSVLSLQAFLPKTIGLCSISYLNFLKPTILIKHPSTEFNQGRPSPSCLAAAKEELRKYGLNPNRFIYQTVIVSEEGD